MISVTLHFKLSKEFYLSLPSHSNRNEFPQNRSSQFSLFTTSPIGWKDSDRKWVWVVSPSQTSTSTWCDSRRWPNISGVLVGYWFRLSVHKVSWAPKLLPWSWRSRASYTITTSWTISVLRKLSRLQVRTSQKFQMTHYKFAESIFRREGEDLILNYLRLDSEVVKNSGRLCEISFHK